jgi:hypothetical protein
VSPAPWVLISSGDREYMGDSHSSKPGSRPGGLWPPAKTPQADAKPAPAAGESTGRAGRVVHDERGNAVWDWIKETSRIAIDSTSRLLKRLEVPELKIEEAPKNELTLESDRDAGGGYDPYGGITSSKGASRSGPSNSRNGALGGTRGGGGSGPGAAGGYDPYGKGTARKR